MYGHAGSEYFTACGIALRCYLEPHISVALGSEPVDGAIYLTGTFGTVCPQCVEKQLEICRIVDRFL